MTGSKSKLLSAFPYITTAGFATSSAEAASLSLAERHYAIN